MASTLTERYSAAMKHLAGACRAAGNPCTIRPATSTEVESFRRIGMREPVLSLYARAVFDQMAETNIRVGAPREVLYENTHLGPGEDICPLGFVVIGSSMCGDVFALDQHSPSGPDGPAIILVSHERNWTNADEVVAKSLRIAGSIVDFLIGAAQQSWDY